MIAVLCIFGTHKLLLHVNVIFPSHIVTVAMQLQPLIGGLLVYIFGQQNLPSSWSLFGMLCCMGSLTLLKNEQRQQVHESFIDDQRDSVRTISDQGIDKPDKELILI